jgi:hypothetical protein
MAECPRCKTEVPREDLRFCTGCGHDLAAVDTSPLSVRPTVLKTDPAGAVPRLIRFQSSGERHDYQLNQAELAIGKAAHNQIVLDDPTVSASHAIISHSQDGYSILDLASRNGTWLNGERLSNRSRILQHGDRIQVGETILTFRLTDRNEAIQPAAAPAGELRPSAPPPAADRSNRTIMVSLPRNVREVVGMERRPLPERGRRPVRTRANSRLTAALVNSASRIISTLIGASLTIGLALYLTRQASQPGMVVPPIPNAKSMTIAAEGVWVDFNTGILGERLEVSGAATRPGAAGMLLVTDRGSTDLIWMPIDGTGAQSGPLTPLPVRLSTPDEFVDPEAITYGNSFFYLLTSQSDPVDRRQHHLMRFDFDAVTREVRGSAESIGNLRDLLLKNIPELSATGAIPGSLGGLNAEGLAWDPGNERLLIGLRSPLIGNQAVLVPLQMADPRGGFTPENLKFAEPRLIILPLDGQGIRDITYDPQIRNFLILSGPPENRPADNFNLWEWNGRNDGRPRRLLTLDGQQKPEGIASLSVDGHNYLFITGDAGSYVRLNYREEP